ncbi:hypothetical protein HDK77DRAFT_226777 [Phyllosticta capitalensis]
MGDGVFEMGTMASVIPGVCQVRSLEEKVERRSAPCSRGAAAAAAAPPAGCCGSAGGDGVGGSGLGCNLRLCHGVDLFDELHWKIRKMPRFCGLTKHVSQVLFAWDGVVWTYFVGWACSRRRWKSASFTLRKPFFRALWDFFSPSSCTMFSSRNILTRSNSRAQSPSSISVDMRELAEDDVLRPSRSTEGNAGRVFSASGIGEEVHSSRIWSVSPCFLSLLTMR